MTNRQFFLHRRKAELPAFLNVFRALDHERLDYTPTTVPHQLHKSCGRSPVNRRPAASSLARAEQIGARHRPRACTK
jgi:hypothetical protein